MVPSWEGHGAALEGSAQPGARGKVLGRIPPSRRIKIPFLEMGKNPWACPEDADTQV